MVLFQFDENLIPELDIRGGWVRQMADATGHSTGMLLEQWRMFRAHRGFDVPHGSVTKIELYVFHRWTKERYDNEVEAGKAAFQREVRAAIVVYGLENVRRWMRDAER